MKILGVLITVACVVLNIIIGSFLYQGKVPFLAVFKDDNSVNERKATDTLNNSKFVTYTDPYGTFYFQYPESWPIATTEQDRKENSSLIDTFESSDRSDNFMEGFDLYGFPTKEISFDASISYMLKSLPEADSSLKILEQKKLVINGLPAYEFIYSVVVPANRGLSSFDEKARVILFNMGEEAIMFEFSDQISTYEQTNKIFQKVIDSYRAAKESTN